MRDRAGSNGFDHRVGLCLLRGRAAATASANSGQYSAANSHEHQHRDRPPESLADAPHSGSERQQQHPPKDRREQPIGQVLSIEMGRCRGQLNGNRYRAQRSICGQRP